MDGEVPESCKASFHTPSLGLMAMFGDEDDADDDIENSEDCDICLIFPQTTVRHVRPKMFLQQNKKTFYLTNHLLPTILGSHADLVVFVSEYS